MAAIGKELGIKASTVSYHMEKLGLEANGKSGKGKKKEVSKVEKETREPIKEAAPQVLEELKKETKKNVEELREILPKSIPDSIEEPTDYEVVDGTVETLTAQQYYELAKMTLQLLKVIWEG